MPVRRSYSHWAIGPSLSRRRFRGPRACSWANSIVLTRPIADRLDPDAPFVAEGLASSDRDVQAKAITPTAPTDGVAPCVIARSVVAASMIGFTRKHARAALFSARSCLRNVAGRWYAACFSTSGEGATMWWRSRSLRGAGPRSKRSSRSGRLGGRRLPDVREWESPWRTGCAAGGPAGPAGDGFVGVQPAGPIASAHRTGPPEAAAAFRRWVFAPAAMSSSVRTPQA